MSLTSTHLLPDELHTQELTDDERYALLAVEERRLVLESLADRTAPMALDELAEEVAIRSEGTVANDEAVERLKIVLHHAHLPKMDDLGVLGYDTETNVVEPRTSP